MDWQTDHKTIIYDFLLWLNSLTQKYILKGGTALMCCYGLNRFSEDIDLDGKDGQIENYVSEFCKIRNYSHRVAKNTATVNRCMVQYNNNFHPLKIETSFRRTDITGDDVNFINGVTVYNINQLCLLKAAAYIGRDKIRDLFDLAFIYNTYKQSLSNDCLSLVQNVVAQKGIEQVEYLTKTQNDKLIDKEKLTEHFLEMYDGLGLLRDN